MGIASFKPGARDRKKEVKPEEAELEEFLFENQIEFVSDQVSEGVPIPTTSSVH